MTKAKKKKEAVEDELFELRRTLNEVDGGFRWLDNQVERHDELLEELHVAVRRLEAEVVGRVLSGGVRKEGCFKRLWRWLFGSGG